MPVAPLQRMARPVDTDKSVTCTCIKRIDSVESKQNQMAVIVSWPQNGRTGTILAFPCQFIVERSVRQHSNKIKQKSQWTCSCLTCTAHVPHVPSPRQLISLDRPLCGVTPFSSMAVKIAYFTHRHRALLSQASKNNHWGGLRTWIVTRHCHMHEDLGLLYFCFTLFSFAQDAGPAHPCAVVAPPWQQTSFPEMPL